MPDAESCHLVSRPEVENEWWYYHGHLEGGSRRLAFHVAFFRRSAQRIRIGSVIPVRFFCTSMRFAHFGLTDIDRQQFRYAHQRSIQRDAGETTDRFRVWMRKWSAEGTREHQHLSCAMRGVELELDLVPVKPPVRHGLAGYRTSEGGQQAVYYSYPRMEAIGRVVLGREEIAVRGQAWMDRDYGRFTLDRHLRGWDWFAIQLNDGRQLMIFRMRDHEGRQSSHSLVTFVDADGSVVRLPGEAVQLLPAGEWQSHRTRITYPVNWRLQVPQLDIDLNIAALMPDQELDTRGSTSTFYWEGPTAVSGSLRNQSVTGHGYLEMVGYGNPRGFGLYDFEADNLGLFGWIANEFRLRVFGPGVLNSPDSDKGGH